MGAPRIDRLDVSAYRVATDGAESDGTLEWDATTLVLVEAAGGGERGIGWSYTDVAAAHLAASVLRRQVVGCDALSLPAMWEKMVRACRNLGRPGIVSCAVAAVDVALWDLKARLLGLALVDLLGGARKSVPVYGSGGFTSYPIDRLRGQLAGWVERGIRRVKMKVGRDPDADGERVREARDAIGGDEIGRAHV